MPVLLGGRHCQARSIFKCTPECSSRRRQCEPTGCISRDPIDPSALQKCETDSKWYLVLQSSVEANAAWWALLVGITTAPSWQPHTYVRRKGLLRGHDESDPFYVGLLYIKIDRAKGTSSRTQARGEDDGCRIASSTPIASPNRIAHANKPRRQLDNLTRGVLHVFLLHLLGLSCCGSTLVNEEMRVQSKATLPMNSYVLRNMHFDLLRENELVARPGVERRC
jgi:hypothetical protein